MKKSISGIIETLTNVWKEYAPLLRSIWKSYGYYISLACLLTLFGITAYMYRTDSNTEAIMTSGSVVKYENTAPVLSVTASPAPAPTPFAPHFLIPVNGDIANKYSPDELIWNETLGQWLVHNGVDISVNTGTVVAASEDGTVSAVYDDSILGLTIEITHDDGWITRYCSLETLQLVNVGDKVCKGDVISSAGTSAIAECASGPHLHFEVLKNGKYIEPSFE